MLTLPTTGTDGLAIMNIVIETTSLIATPADWTSAGLTLTLGSDGNLHIYKTGTTIDAVPPCSPASVTNIEITAPSSTAANLTIDTTNGDPIPAGGLDCSGGGGLIVTGPGTVTLSGPNSYTGGTTVSTGTLLITAASALPDGTRLTIGADGTFVFDPSQAGTSVSAAELAALTAASATCPPIVAASVFANVPVTAPIVSTLSPFVQRQVENVSYGPATMSRATIDAVFASHRSALDQTVSSPGIPHPAGSWAWLAAIETSWNSSDQNKTTDSKVAALDKVLAQYGV